METIFGRWAEQDRRRRGEGKPETFDFLGFTHYCGKHRKGYFCVWRKTTRKRLVAKLRQIKQQLRVCRHEPIPQVGEWLPRVVTGVVVQVCRAKARCSSRCKSCPGTGRPDRVAIPAAMEVTKWSKPGKHKAA